MASSLEKLLHRMGMLLLLPLLVLVLALLALLALLLALLLSVPLSHSPAAAPCVQGGGTARSTSARPLASRASSSRTSGSGAGRR